MVTGIQNNLVLADPCPFVGPRPLETGERMCCRSKELSELYFQLQAERIVVLYSPSGAGKSSLIQAGLVPKMRDNFDVWLPTRVNTEPEPGTPKSTNRYALSAMIGFEQGVRKDLRRQTSAFADLRLIDYVMQRPRRQGASQNLFLIFDQFEEVLTIDPIALEAKEEFFNQLGELLRQPNIWALMALREDYLAAFDPYAQLLPTHMKNRFRLDRFSIQDAEQAISGPTEFTNRKFAVGMPALLANNLARVKIQKPDGSFLEDQKGNFVEPMQLQVVCRELWQQMHADDLSIDREDIDQYGDVSKALANYYAHQVEEISGKNRRVERRIRLWVGTKLITASGIRNQVLMDKEKSGGLENVFINELVKSHLVRPEVRGNAIWYELSHDSLIRSVRRSNLEWNEEKLHKVQKEAALWKEKGELEGLLLSGPDLEDALHWQTRNAQELEEEEIRFIAESVDRQKRLANEALLAQREIERAKWARIWSVVFAAIALFAIGAFIYALQLKSLADDASLASFINEAKAEIGGRSARDAQKLAQAERDKAETSLELAKKSQQEARLSAAQAQANLVRLMEEKSVGFQTSAEMNGSPMDFQNSWIYLAAALANTAQPSSDSLARLFVANQWPGSRLARNKVHPPQAAEFKLASFFEEGPTTLGVLTVRPSESNDSCFPAGHNFTNCDPFESKSETSSVTAFSKDKLAFRVRGNTKGEISINGVNKWTDKRATSAISALAVGSEWLAAGDSKGQLFVLGGLDKQLTVEAYLPGCDKGCPGVTALAWSRDKDPLLLAAYSDSSLQCFRKVKSRLMPSGPRIGGRREETIKIGAVQFWHGTSFFFLGRSSGFIDIMDHRTGQVAATLRLHDKPILALGSDKTGKLLFSVTGDSVVKQTPLEVDYFDSRLHLSNLLQPAQAAPIFQSIYHKSLERLDYRIEGQEPKAGTTAWANALNFFGKGASQPFTLEALKAGSLLLRERAPASLVYPAADAADSGQFLLVPNSVEAARSVIQLKKQVTGPFKLDFEFRVHNSVDQDFRRIGDGISIYFFKNPEQFKSPNFFDSESSIQAPGYHLWMNAYAYIGRGLRLFAPEASSKGYRMIHQTSEGRTYTGDRWQPACLEVSPVESEPMCNPGGGRFQGVRIYYGNTVVMHHPVALDPKFGAMGFIGATGEAVAEQSVRKVRLSQPGLPTTAELRRADLQFWNVKESRSSTERYPQVLSDRINLTPDETFAQANAILLNPATSIPQDFSVEFEYSTRTEGSQDSYSTGRGLAFLFDVDSTEYQKQLLPQDDALGRIAKASNAIMIKTFGSRRIEFCRAGSEAGPGCVKATIPPSLGAIYTSGQWRKMRVEVSNSTATVRILYEGFEVLRTSLPAARKGGTIGFSSATGQFSASRGVGEHSIRNVVLRDLSLANN